MITTQPGPIAPFGGLPVGPGASYGNPMLPVGGGMGNTLATGNPAAGILGPGATTGGAHIGPWGQLTNFGQPPFGQQPFPMLPGRTTGMGGTEPRMNPNDGSGGFGSPNPIFQMLNPILSMLFGGGLGGNNMFYSGQSGTPMSPSGPVTGGGMGTNGTNPLLAILGQLMSGQQPAPAAPQAPAPPPQAPQQPGGYGGGGGDRFNRRFEM